MFFFSSKPAACEWRVRTCFLKARFRAFDNRLTSLLGKINRKIEHVLQGQCHGRMRESLAQRTVPQPRWRCVMG